VSTKGRKNDTAAGEEEEEEEEEEGIEARAGFEEISCKSPHEPYTLALLLLLLLLLLPTAAVEELPVTLTRPPVTVAKDSVRGKVSKGRQGRRSEMGAALGTIREARASSPLGQEWRVEERSWGVVDAAVPAARRRAVTKFDSCDTFPP